jgi:hypothetical protein
MTKMRRYFSPISLLESEVPTFSESLGVLVFAGRGTTSILGADHQDVAMIRWVFEKGLVFGQWWKRPPYLGRVAIKLRRRRMAEGTF